MRPADRVLQVLVKASKRSQRLWHGYDRQMNCCFRRVVHRHRQVTISLVVHLQGATGLVMVEFRFRETMQHGAFISIVSQSLHFQDREREIDRKPHLLLRPFKCALYLIILGLRSLRFLILEKRVSLESNVSSRLCRLENDIPLC